MNSLEHGSLSLVLVEWGEWRTMSERGNWVCKDQLPTRRNGHTLKPNISLNYTNESLFFWIGSNHINRSFFFFLLSQHKMNHFQSINCRLYNVCECGVTLGWNGPPPFAGVRSHQQTPYYRKDSTYGCCQILVFLSLVESIFALFIHTYIYICVCMSSGVVISILSFKATSLLSTRFLVLFLFFYHQFCIECVFVCLFVRCCCFLPQR